MNELNARHLCDCMVTVNCVHCFASISQYDSLATTFVEWSEANAMAHINVPGYIVIRFGVRNQQQNNACTSASIVLLALQ